MGSRCYSGQSDSKVEGVLKDVTKGERQVSHWEAVLPMLLVRQEHMGCTKHLRLKKLKEKELLTPRGSGGGKTARRTLPGED